MSDGDKRDCIFLTASTIQNAKSRFEVDRSLNSQLNSEFLTESFKLITSPFSLGRRGYWLLIFGKSATPDILYYSDNDWFKQANSNQVAYLFDLLGLNSYTYLQFWKQGGVLYLIGEEPEHIKRERLLKELTSTIDVSYKPDNLILQFILGTAIHQVYLPKNLTNQEKERLTESLLKYQIRTDNQTVLTTKVYKNDRRFYDDYLTCKNEREKLFFSIMELGWSYPEINHQVRDTKFKEWDTEKDSWNIHKTDVVFSREMR